MTPVYRINPIRRPLDVAVYKNCVCVCGGGRVLKLKVNMHVFKETSYTFSLPFSE